MLFSAAKKSPSGTLTFSKGKGDGNLKTKNAVVKNMNPSHLPGVKKYLMHFPKPSISISKMKKTMIDWYCKRALFNTEIPCMMSNIVKSAKTSSDDTTLSSIEMLSIKISTKSLRDSFSKMFQIFCKISPYFFYDEYCIFECNCTLYSNWDIPCFVSSSYGDQSKEIFDKP